MLSLQKLIDLSEQQKRDVVEMKRLFLQKIDPIMEERKMLNMQIQSNLPHDTFATRNALTYIKVRYRSGTGHKLAEHNARAHFVEDLERMRSAILCALILPHCAHHCAGT